MWQKQKVLLSETQARNSCTKVKFYAFKQNIALVSHWSLRTPIAAFLGNIRGEKLWAKLQAWVMVYFMSYCFEKDEKT